ncbi:MAG: MBL fold metallo-hydrolase [Oscillospiraceae bacterium]|nr:MBL fold metallo-hydrolase [Oscillospiraceae bacterium]
MKIVCLPLGYYQTNTYILYNEGGSKCLVIDPGYEAFHIMRYVNQLNLKVEAILLTHGHFDHVGAVRPLVADTDCAVYINSRESAMPEMMTAGKLYFTHTYDEGDTLTLAGLTFTVLATPGHTPGSVCLDFGDHMFTGDTLFAGSCGRVDLPGGDARQMRQSLARLAALDKSCWIHPGHGPGSHLGKEKQTNPYLV